MSIVPDFDTSFSTKAPSIPVMRLSTIKGGSQFYWFCKSVVDVFGSLFLLAAVALLSIILLALNPFFNPGPLFYSQRRMGQFFEPFTILKFRTMYSENSSVRGPNEPLERHRITKLGRILRQTGLDELPQALNVLMGQMSLIGPRPDCVSHAEHFIRTVPQYHLRYAIRPGLSGLAQVRSGYAIGSNETRIKVEQDLSYISAASFSLDTWIALQTLWMIVTRRGT